MSDRSVQRLYGLRVASEVPLFQRRPTGETAVDVAIRWGESRPIPSEEPAGKVLVRFEADGKLRYAFATDQDGQHVLRFCESCEFVVSPDLATVSAHAAPNIDTGLVSVLAAGAVLSFILVLRGEPVLHASAVDLGNEAIAFAGSSGMGKSTMAALLCASGHRLITDDVLRLDVSRGVPRCHLGATELRLRKAAAELAAAFDRAPDSRRTSDDRDALQLTGSTTDLLPLRAIVVPRPGLNVPRVDVRRLGGVEAVLTLVRFPRIVGWESPAIESAQFAHLARLAEQVPVFVADVPWGPPFPAGIAAALLEQTLGATF